MAENGRTICIAGAGISGLTLALALAQRGAKVVVLERNDAIQEFGAGLQISPNARYALNSLGLDAALSAVSFEPEGIDVFAFGHKRPLSTLELGQAARDRFNLPYAVMHRADLVHVLFNATRQYPEIEVHFDVEGFEVADHQENPAVTYRYANGEVHTLNAHAFIGADGVGSKTRTSIVGGKEADYSGYVAWRTLVDIDRLKDILPSDKTSMLWGPGFHAIAYPLLHRKIFNIALFTKESMSVAFGIHATPNLPPIIHKDMRFNRILASAGEWTHWPLASVNTRRWYQGAVGLVGDAAHAMLPFQAQGAAMGIEDALALAPLLVSEDKAETALLAYENARRVRVSRVVQTSAKNGRIFHMHGPVATARNIVVQLQGGREHFKRLSWLYDHNPLPS